jgi:hypothetical protein
MRVGGANLALQQAPARPGTSFVPDEAKLADAGRQLRPIFPVYQNR